jgi:hypothetical protein
MTRVGSKFDEYPSHIFSAFFPALLLITNSAAALDALGHEETCEL